MPRSRKRSRKQGRAKKPPGSSNWHTGIPKEEGESSASAESELPKPMGAACLELLFSVHPFDAPDGPEMNDIWGYPLPLSWTIQARYFWAAVADAFQVVGETLGVRAAPTVLAQIRHMMEGLAWLRWLGEEEGTRHARSFALALEKIRRLRHALREVTAEGAGMAAMEDENYRDMEGALLKLASEDRISAIPELPTMKSIFERFGMEYFLYRILSDTGSHAGVSYVLTMFQSSGQYQVTFTPESAPLHRAYFMLLAYRTYVQTAITIAMMHDWKYIAERAREVASRHEPLLHLVEHSWLDRFESGGKHVH